MSSDNGVDSFVAAAERAMTGNDPAAVSDQDIERVLTAAVRLYAARAETTANYPPPVTRESVSATDIATVASEMIRAVDINLFDLSMWYRRPR
jgi:hypothetical protein